MTPFIYSNEAVFCIVLTAYLFAAFVGVVCFAMSLSYKLKLRYVLPELAVSARPYCCFAICVTALEYAIWAQNRVIS